ncbi:MAG: hypothetical protein NC217_07670 [Muribaculaceae bacterium]|nr:hypothetical protein [Muribaculaceae bacterium]
MKLLDYTGLSRLTANIKAYITAKLQPIEDTTPYLLPGIVSAGGGMQHGTLGPSTEDSWCTNGKQVTLTDASTGVQKEVYNRLSRGFPGILLIKTASAAASSYVEGVTPLFPHTGTSNHYIYKNPSNVFKGQYIKVDIQKSSSTGYFRITTTLETPEEITHPDYEAELPCPWLIQSIAADGTIVNSGTKQLSASSTGNALTLYNRLQKGMPPCFVVDMATSAGSTVKVFCYLTAILASGKTYQYQSGSLTNGTISDKIANIMVSTAGSAVLQLKATTT